MDISKYRSDFPLLQHAIKGKLVVYFDNACQTLRPQSVIDAITSYYLESSACSGRSMHQLAVRVTQACDEARGTLAKFINAAKKEEIVFTRNTTEGINLVAHSLGLKAGDAVLISDKEHNSNLIPWQQLVKHHGIQLRIVPTKPDNTFDLPAFEAMLAKEVRLVSLAYTSNLDGVTYPVAEIIKQAHANGSLVLLDAAQAVPHHKVDVKALGVDFLAFSGHKMLGPSGTGVLYGKYKLLEALEPFLTGGDTVSVSTYETCQFLPPPEKFEAGLQDYAGMIGLGAAAKYLMKVGFDAIQKQEHALNKYITDALAVMPRVHILGPADAGSRGGIVSFTVDGADHHQVALTLDRMANITLRSGQHCVHSWFGSRGIPGSVRASLYFYNTLDEADLFIQNLQKVLKVL